MPSQDLNRKQTAQALRIAPRAIDRLIRDADCPLRPGRKRGRLLHWPAAQVEATRLWLAARETAPKNKPEKNAPGARPAPTLAERLAAFPMPRGTMPRETEPSTSRPTAAQGAQVAQVAESDADEPTRHGPPFPVAPLCGAQAFGPPGLDPTLFAPLLGMMNPFWWISVAAAGSETT